MAATEIGNHFFIDAGVTPGASDARLVAETGIEQVAYTPPQGTSATTILRAKPENHLSVKPAVKFAELVGDGSRPDIKVDNLQSKDALIDYVKADLQKTLLHKICSALNLQSGMNHATPVLLPNLMLNLATGHDIFADDGTQLTPNEAATAGLSATLLDCPTPAAPTAPATAPVPLAGPALKNVTIDLGTTTLGEIFPKCFTPTTSPAHNQIDALEGGMAIFKGSNYHDKSVPMLVWLFVVGVPFLSLGLGIFLEKCLLSKKPAPQRPVAGDDSETEEEEETKKDGDSEE